MNTAFFAPPRTENREPRMMIPLWLALPAGGAVLLIIALVAATLSLVSARDLGRASSPAPDTAATVPAARPGAAPGGTPAGPRAQRLAELEGRFQAARDEFEAGRHTEAFAAFATLADEGHCDSARLALQLVQAGPEAYLTSFEAGPQQISRWRGLPGCWPKAAIR